MSSGLPQAALAGLFVAHLPQLHLAAKKILGTPEQADDVVQDAYVKVVESAGLFQVRQPLAYLFRIVRNLAIDRYRQVAQESRYHTAQDEGLQVPTGSDSPEALAIHKQRLLLVANAMARQPERTQLAFELHRLGGLTQREIADRLGISVTLVNFMLRDATVSCRAAIEAA